MSIRLTIDRGNTALKAAVWQDGEITRLVALAASAPVAEAVRLLGITAGDAPRTAYCSVVAEHTADDRSYLESIGTLFDIKSPDIALPFDIAYRTPSTLGADRIAALTGAVGMVDAPAVLVADLGTAATFDLLDNSCGKPLYRGGNISPGVPLRLRSLHEHTSALPAVSPEAVPAELWGTSTADAILGGAVRGIVAELLYYRAHAPLGCAVVLTGGGADYLVKNNLVPFEHIYDSHLVLRGLNSIIEPIQ